jgi:hypothetical protein
MYNLSMYLLFNFIFNILNIISILLSIWNILLLSIWNVYLQNNICIRYKKYEIDIFILIIL